MSTSKNKRDYSAALSSPEERVNVFILHWHDQWSTAQKKMGDNVDFEYWGKLVSELEVAHFISGSRSDSRNSFGSKADHDLQWEKITECDVQGDLAQVYTEMYDEELNSLSYHAYDLKRDESSGWLISSIFTLFYPPKEPVIDRNKHTDTLALSMQSAPFIDRQENLNLNENILFQKDRHIKLANLEGIAKLEEVGRFRVSSGILGILDFGYDIYDFEPLHKKVSPGEYPVETVTIHNRVAGIRVKFCKDEVPVKWYAANTPSGNGVYGVDAGNLAIFDVANLLDCSRIEKERLFGEWCLSGQPKVVSMSDQHDCVITSSGFGDGAYPAFWGVNEQEQIVSLYIDFLILVQEDEEGTYISV
ncbi:DUF4241 domain-containing protein [Agarilytica rhodophyticola]|uniref:DUF4241 domain-containing protein n=1 Tax=Agarilytica rhodophyticola TaxID=1737490 RepID=UPI000B346863|nr:DUF4241 domain-containing protein [Agarilytica rhodophyticola]